MRTTISVIKAETAINERLQALAARLRSPGEP